MTNEIAGPKGTRGLSTWAGYLYLLGGGGLTTLSLVLLGVFLSGGMNDQVPHACASLECLHDIAEAPDGRRHCARFPPADLKLSATAWHQRQALGFSSGILGLVCAVAMSGLGGRWLFGRQEPRPGSPRRITLAVVVPVGAFAGPILLRALAWPLGFFSF